MKKKGVFLFGILCFTLVLAIAAYAVEMGAKCPLCGMNIAGNENTAYEITYMDGTVETYCCPHCGLYEQATKKEHGQQRNGVQSHSFGPEYPLP